MPPPITSYVMCLLVVLVLLFGLCCGGYKSYTVTLCVYFKSLFLADLNSSSSIKPFSLSSASS